MSMRKYPDTVAASALEMREMINQGDLELYTPINPKHQFFDKIKTAPYQAYKGPWGREHIYWDGESAAVLRTHPDRAQEILAEIYDLLYGEHNE